MKTTLERARNSTSNIRSFERKQIYEDTILDIMVEEMSGYSLRYGYHTASDYEFETQDIYRHIAVKYLRGMFPKERARRLLNKFNNVVAKSNLTQFTEMEIISILGLI